MLTFDGGMPSLSDYYYDDDDCTDAYTEEDDTDDEEEEEEEDEEATYGTNDKENGGRRECRDDDVDVESRGASVTSSSHGTDATALRARNNGRRFWATLSAHAASSAIVAARLIIVGLSVLLFLLILMGLS